MLDIDELFFDIYLTATGNLLPEYTYPGVPNEYAPGGDCYEAFEEASAARDRIAQRLGVPDEDDDLELMLNALLDIEIALCRKMFYYGMRAASLPE